MNKNKMILTDANNKTFEVSISDITDMTTDLEGDFVDHNISDAESRSMANFEPKILDSKGKELEPTELLDKVNKGQASMPKAIDVLFEATHSGGNRNSMIYHSDSMEKDTHTWKTPFAKPFLKNHNMNSEPLGRVKDAYHGKSEFNPDRDCINVVYRISDADAIEKFLDGRYRTMSIGGTVGSMSCNICGKDILKDGMFKFCGHWRGETYANQKALWNARDIEYKEGSVVNAPADDWAQVKRITVVDGETKDSDDGGSEEGTLKDKSEEDIDVTDNILDDIDNLAATDEENSKEVDEKEPKDNSNKEEPEDSEGEGTSEDKAKEEDSETTDALNREILSLKDEIVNLKGNELILTDEIEKLKDEKRVLVEENKSVIEDSQSSRKQSIKLAVMHKKLLAERVVDLELVSNKLTDETKQERLDELIKKSAKDLSDMVVNVSNSTIKTQRDLADQIENPGSANLNDGHSIEDDESEEGKIEEETEEKSFKDLEDTLMKIIAR